MNPADPPPGYMEQPSSSSSQYGQSTLLHGDGSAEQAIKISQHQPAQPPQHDPSIAPYPPPGPFPNPGPSGGPPGYPPYGAPPYGHPMDPAYPGPPQHYFAPVPMPPQQQQQQSVVVVGGQQNHSPVLIQHVQSFTGHIILACFVFWCCCPVFGLIAFILAMAASSSAVSNPRNAHSLGQASYGLSITGIVLSILVVIIVIAVVFSTRSSSYGYSGGYSSYSSCPYYYYGSSCYRSRYATYSSYRCSGYYYRRYCYYNTYYG